MAISFLQRTSNSFGTAQASLQTNITATTAGSIVVVFGIVDNATGITSITVTDSAGDTYTIGLGLTTEAIGPAYFFYGAFFAPTTGTTFAKVTYNGGTSPTFGGLVVWEIAGLTNAAFDKFVRANGLNGTNPDSGSSGTLSASAEAAICYVGIVNTMSGGSAGTGWSNFNIVTALGDAYEEMVVSSNAAINGTMTAPAGSGDWESHLITVMSVGGATLDTAWFRPSEEPLPRKVLAHRFQPPPAFVSTFRTAAISGIGWHRDFPEANPRPPIRFQPPPTFVSTFKTAGISGIAFARRESETIPWPVRKFEPPPAWNPQTITQVVTTPPNGWFVNSEVLRKALSPISVPSTVLAPPAQAPRGWFVVPENFNRKSVPIDALPIVLSPPVVTPTVVPYGWFVNPEIIKLRPVFLEQPIGFVSNFQTARIAGIAWMTPIDVFPLKRLILNDPSQVYTPQQQAVIAVVYGFMFPDVYKPRSIPRDDAPAFVPPITQLVTGWFNTPAQDRYGLNLRMDMPPAFGRSVVDTTIAGWLNQPAQDRYSRNVYIDSSPAFGFAPVAPGVPISGMAWFAPIQNATINRGLNANSIAAWMPQEIIQIVPAFRPGVNRLRTLRGGRISSLSRKIRRKI
jgi:hypothetical protein